MPYWLASHLILPEGAEVEIWLEPSALSEDLQEELAAWEQASDDAWSLIDEWEQGQFSEAA